MKPQLLSEVSASTEEQLMNIKITMHHFLPPKNLTVSETVSCLGEEGSNKKSIYILHYQGATLNMDGYIKSTYAKKKPQQNKS